MTEYVVFDIETLGMAPPAALIELGWNSVRHPGDGCDFSLGGLQGSDLFGIPAGQIMSPDNRAVHHIDPAQLEGCLEWNPDVRTEYAAAFDGDYAVAHNAAFEALWLDFGVPWICTYKAALRLWPEAPSHSNQALKYFLGIPDCEEHHPPHRALPDAIVTSQILVKILQTGVLPSTLVAWTNEPPLTPRCPIGKWRGRPWAEVEYGFLNWMLGVADMEEDLKWRARLELDRRNQK